MLGNLADNFMQQLTAFMQKCSERGEIPGEWKKANLVLIPNPGKELKLENLRPTSCVGKVMEHVIQNRLNGYLESKELYPKSMVGFRQQLSTNDVMLQLKEQVLETKTSDWRVIVGLDVSKAFDNVKNQAIISHLNYLNVGGKLYNYIKSFLTD
nr:uncharacterized protein LOC126548334 [Dermacentor andersoni]